MSRKTSVVVNLGKLLCRLPRGWVAMIALDKGVRTHRVHVRVHKSSGDAVLVLEDYPKTADVEHVLTLSLKQACDYLGKHIRSK